MTERELSIGVYWYRAEATRPWRIVEVMREEYADPVLWVHVPGDEMGMPLRDMRGTFIGPLTPPDFYHEAAGQVSAVGVEGQAKKVWYRAHLQTPVGEGSHGLPQDYTIDLTEDEMAVALIRRAVRVIQGHGVWHDVPMSAWTFTVLMPSRYVGVK